MNKQEYDIQHDSAEDAYHSARGAGLIVIFVLIVVAVVLGALVYVTAKNGTFCPVTAVVLCGLAVLGATAKGVR